MRCCFNLNKDVRNVCFNKDTLRELGKLVDLKVEAPSKVTKKWLKKQVADCEILITGWTSIPLDQEILDAAPALKFVLHSAGSIKHLETAEMWQRGIRVTSAANVNGIPVAEFLLGQILMCFKDVFAYQKRFREGGRAAWTQDGANIAGYYGSTVGIIGMGNVGKHLLKLLGAFEFKKLVHSFYPFEKQAKEAGARLVKIDEIMRKSDAVVLLAPNIPQNKHMIDARRFALMKDGAFFLNSGRGALVDENALIKALQSGRINACIDVSDPVEPPAEGSPLYNLPNCVITPHIAGAVHNECHRLGNQVLKELRRYLSGAPFENEITEELAKVIG